MPVPTIQEIDARREAAGISAGDLARHAGTNPETFSRWRHGVQSPTQRSLENVDDTLTRLIAGKIERLRELQP